MHRILLLGESEKVKEKLKADLQNLDYEVIFVNPQISWTEEISKVRPPDIILLELTSQALDYVKTVKNLKKDMDSLNLKDVPLLLLTRREQIKEFDFTCGIDDFILEPYTIEELQARLNQILWRLSKLEDKDIIKIRDLVINLASYEVSIKGKRLEFTYQEFELLRFLATHPKRVHTREALLNRVWGYNYYGGTRTVDVHIRRLRAKLGNDYDYLIQTIRNVGYMFMP